MPDDPEKVRKRLHRLLREAVTLTKRLAQPEPAREVSASAVPSRFHVERYGGTRFFALYEGDHLLAVTVYRKGAEAVRERLQALEARLAALAHTQEEDRPQPTGAVARLQAERNRGRACIQRRG